jgi:hypothetical protein
MPSADVYSSTSAASWMATQTPENIISMKLYKSKNTVWTYPLPGERLFYHKKSYDKLPPDLQQ